MNDLSCDAMLAKGFRDRPALLMVTLGNEVAVRAEDPLAGLGLSGRQYMALAVLSTDEPTSQAVRHLVSEPDDDTFLSLVMSFVHEPYAPSWNMCRDGPSWARES